jgi:hypothetical protein
VTDPDVPEPMKPSYRPPAGPTLPRIRQALRELQQQQPPQAITVQAVTIARAVDVAA